MYMDEGSKEEEERKRKVDGTKATRQNDTFDSMGRQSER